MIDWQTLETAEQKAAKEAEAVKKAKTALVQAYLDRSAAEYGYDNIVSLCSYASSSDARFAQEGRAGSALRDAVWRRCHELLAEVEGGTRGMPTDEELLAELPSLSAYLEAPSA